MGAGGHPAGLAHHAELLGCHRLLLLAGRVVLGLVSVGIGVIAGIVPAVMASNLRPGCVQAQ
jgi:hypothetical protein